VSASTTMIQESLADAKVSASQQCVYDGPSRGMPSNIKVIYGQIFVHIIEILMHKTKRIACYPHPTLVWRPGWGEPVRISGWNLSRKKTRGIWLLYGKTNRKMENMVFHP